MGTRPLPFPEQPKSPVVERRLANLEKRSLTRQAIGSDDYVSDNTDEYAWGVDGTLTTGTSSPKPIWVPSTLVAFYAVVLSVTTTSTVIELLHNGITIPFGLTLAAGTNVEGTVYVGEGFAPGDTYEIAVVTAGSGAALLQTWSVFGT